MLRLSKKADYALIAMKHLAVRGDRVAGGSSSAREIAELYDIPIELMAKVLQRLVRRGLLASQQGTRGGYQLARVPTAISVADVIQAIDGPVAVTACSSSDDGACEQFAKCNVRDRRACGRPAVGERRTRGSAAHAFVRDEHMSIKLPIYMDYHATTPVDPR